jgi:uncharacterized protein (DUF3820 family)
MDYIEDQIMPFGKYKGEQLLDIPVTYLEWIYDNVDLRGDLAAGVKKAIDMLRAEKNRRGF